MRHQRIFKQTLSESIVRGLHRDQIGTRRLVPVARIADTACLTGLKGGHGADDRADRPDELGKLGALLSHHQQTVRKRRGGVHSARSLMLSVDFGTVERLQHDGDWDALGELMIDAARALERDGADFFFLYTNTMHLLADAVAAAVSIPLLHIVDPTTAAIRADGQ